MSTHYHTTPLSRIYARDKYLQLELLRGHGLVVSQTMPPFSVAIKRQMPSESLVFEKKRHHFRRNYAYSPVFVGSVFISVILLTFVVLLTVSRKSRHRFCFRGENRAKIVFKTTFATEKTM